MKSRNILSVLMLIFLVLGLISTSFAQTAPRDRDGDGVLDMNDRCPDVAGSPDSFGCPATNNREDEIPSDSDGDGTANGLDRCPNEAGDGANYGCPAGVDPNNPQAENSSPSDSTPTLLAAPTTGQCVVSTLGTNAVNIREFPTTSAAIIGTIDVNEWVQVIAILETSTVSQNGMGNEIGPMLAPYGGGSDPNSDLNYGGGSNPDPNSDLNYGGNPDPNYSVWLWVQDSDSDAIGWVAEEVIRYGGDCSDLEVDNPNPEAVYLAIELENVLISSYQTGGSSAADDNHKKWIIIESMAYGDGFRGGVRVATGDVDGDGTAIIPIFPSDNPIIYLPTGPSEAAVDYFLKIDGIDGESADTVPTDSFSLNFAKIEYLPEACELSLTGDGSVVPSCDDGSTIPSIVVCTYQELHEAGVFEEVCYEIEIPEGCVVDSSEAGVWHITCDDDGDGVQVSPLGENSPILDLQFEDDSDAILIGLLVPAVQRVREAAAR